MYGIDSGDLEAGVAKRLQKSFPYRAFRVGVVKRKNKQTIIRKPLVNSLEYIAKS